MKSETVNPIPPSIEIPNIPFQLHPVGNDTSFRRTAIHVNEKMPASLPTNRPRKTARVTFPIESESDPSKTIPALTNANNGMMK